jgi:hypothetical protein
LQWSQLGICARINLPKNQRYPQMQLNNHGVALFADSLAA